MRALILALAAATIAAPAAAQQSVDSARTPAPASPPAPPTMDGRLRTEVLLLRNLFRSIHSPVADSFKLGNQEIPAGTTRQGTMAVARGDLSVRGRIVGDAIAVHGDVVVHPGGSVTGNAIAVDGRVRSLGGVVDGDVRSIRGLTAGILAHAAGPGSAAEEPVTTWGALKMVLGWFAVLFVIGIGVQLFAEKNLDGVVAVLEQQFARSFWTGVLVQLAAIPVLLFSLVALAVTIIGILLVPFAIVAYVVAFCGFLALGFIAVARFTGRAFVRSPATSRVVHPRSLFLGLLVYLGLWFLAAAFVWSPIAGSILRAVALAGSWVALTFGLGATILSRAGTRREAERALRPSPADDLSWQTPTPVTGVVAARRPVVATKES
jgi:hypothetical protein